MSATFLLGLALGIVGALMVNIGKGIQKQKVHVFRQGKKMLSREHRRDLNGWLVGFAMTGSSALFYSLGLKFCESPSAVSAMNGVGLIGLALYAVFVIRETMTSRDLIGIALVVAGTSAFGYFGGGGTQQIRTVDSLLLMGSIGGVAFTSAIGCLAAMKWRRIHGLAFGWAAGSCIGIGITLGNAALVRSGGSLLGQLSNPYPYAALVFAISATVITQFGFLRSRALEVVPAINSAVIAVPLALQTILCGSLPSWESFSLISVILAGVIVLSTGLAARVS